MDLFGEEAPPAKQELKPEKTPPPVIHDFGEAEEEEGLQHPRLMNICLGHETLEQEFLDLFNAGRLPHAIILSGTRGIGKATLAFRLARFLLKHGGEDSDQDSMFATTDTPQNATTLDIDKEDKIFHLVAANAHPDMLTIERAYDESKDRYKDSVDVKSIRKVTPFLRMTSSEGSYRIVIIDDADTMNRSAQNALLKILEEPPEKTLIILITHRAGALIPTIKSRARLINVHSLSPEHFKELLEKNGQSLSHKDLETITALAEGSIGKAVEYIDQGGLEILDKLLTLYENFGGAGGKVNWEPIHKLGNDLAKIGQDQQYANFTTLMQWIYQTLLLAKARNLNPPAPLDNTTFQNILATTSLNHLIEICDSLKTHFDSIKYANLDKKQGVLGAFSLINV